MDPTLVTWLRPRHQAVLATTRRDGTPQTSNIVFGFDGTRAAISVTTSRAKTANMSRNPGVVLHVLGDSFWEYASISCTAMLGPVSLQPGDEAGRDLLALYDQVSGAAHPDPDEFFQAMVTEGRLVAFLTPISAVTSGLS
ncbi:MAG: TIGR03618 family F420-dependent PPOX class oxidoreductase [Pseudonocardiales bacterium]|nr:TIGR03618 family F420-dependent PPOX class oxidoreductase [Pseudonocardiales bacterium]